MFQNYLQKFSLTLLLSVITAPVHITLSHAQPQSYELICRGGGAWLVMTGDLNTVTERGRQYVYASVRARFAPGNPNIDRSSADFANASPNVKAFLVQQALAPGECSWIDRGMRNGEPSILCDVTGKSSDVNAIRYINFISRSEARARLMVYNDNGQCLRVTSYENLGSGF
ncbi:hypothetical protein A5482_002845 [Cyanobacterium sp. IPPAS B-1200]|uniref:hypothetical protein n=1 Tax=Cyanobacterium sp. IPPAS B-1200 TaxID=1562720 RepID=UPI0008524A92|nr:hypothetical protein [Cyanobacterium sp. IPPAS B-1200]OEJ77321.1 hypothetical protein A5482_06360 [Cyanobacterium sp. IPPAS B-1200]